MYERSRKSAYCSPYCDSHGRYVSGRTCVSSGNHTVYCCGTETHKFCCYDATMNIGDMPGATDCSEDLNIRVTNLLPWIPVLIILMVAYPLMKRCKFRCDQQGATTAGGADAENGGGDGDDTDTSAPPSPGLPPSYDDVTAKPPPYEEVCGLVNLGFSMEDIDNGADVLRVHNSTHQQAPSGEIASTSQLNNSRPTPSTSNDTTDASTAASTSQTDTCLITVVHVGGTEEESTAEPETVMFGEPPPAYADIPCARI